MTTDYALSIIKRKMGGDESDAKNQDAQAALDSAIGSASGLGRFYWNTKLIAFTLTLGAGSYKLDDLFISDRVLALGAYIYYTANNKRCKMIPVNDFNNYFRYRMTSSGIPEYGVVTGVDKTLELWPCPDSAYTCITYAWVRVTSLDQIPDMYHDAVIGRAVMFAVAADQPNYAWGKAEWDTGVLKMLADKDLEVWDGSRADGDDYAVGSGFHSKVVPNSDNLTAK